MPKQQIRLPGNVPFTCWDDATNYTMIYHVACGHPAAGDDNPGTADLPFATIGKAAQVLQPGEKVIVHQGVYRECVAPARGGESPERMIAYEAASGEDVRISGAEQWAPTFSTHPATPSIWIGELPESFTGRYNPFLATNTCIALGVYEMNWTCEERQRMLLRRGMVFADGRPLKQVYTRAQLLHEQGAFWVEEPGLRIHLRLWDDADPHGAHFEVTTREQVFAPREPHTGYLRVKGFVMEHAADGVPFPQRALLSTNWGHHWIIEENVIRRANACGVDVGRSGYQFYPQDDLPAGGHIIRHNTISDCGVCGIAGVGGNDDTLVEENVIERIGGLVPERVWESAGVKFHFSNRVCIRRNVIRHLREASGVWFDIDARHCRISGNVFADIATAKGAIQMECCFHAPNLIDGNVFWAITRAYDIEQKPPEDPWRGGFGIYADCSDHLTIAHNLFGQIDSYAASLNLCQYNRQVGTRPGMCRHNRVVNNIFSGCPHAILFARLENNVSDGNLFGDLPAATERHPKNDPPLCIQFPDPIVKLDLEGWRDYTGQDRCSTAMTLDASFDVEQLEFTWTARGDAPQLAPVPGIDNDAFNAGPGPLNPELWQESMDGREGRQRFLAAEIPVMSEQSS